MCLYRLNETAEEAWQMSGIRKPQVDTGTGTLRLQTIR